MMTMSPGNSSSIPILPEYPEQSFIAKLPPDEWQACLELWIYSVEYRLRLPAEYFASFSISDDSSGYPFLVSYLQSAPEAGHSVQSRTADTDTKLCKCCHLLLRRLVLDNSLLEKISAFQQYEIFSLGSTTFRRLPKWPETLRLCLKKAPKEVIAAYESGLHSIEHDLSSSDPLSPSTFSNMRKASNLITVAPEAGVVFMTGTDYLQTLVQCYDGAMVEPPAMKVARFVTEHAYICLRSLMKDSTSKMSMLLDHLYSLKAAADASAMATPDQPTLLSSIVCLTTFLRYLEISLGNNHNARGQEMLTFLQDYRQRTLQLHLQTPRPRVASGKGKDKAVLNNDMHMHKASQVSQVHDLFPELPTAYLLRLLDHYSNNIELVIGSLLEPESLPSDLQHPTKDDLIAPKVDLDSGLARPDLSSTLPLSPPRKSVFANDDFDNLQISPDKLHRGRKDKFSEAPAKHDEHSRRKAAIMAALAAFDSDDDERDDTYDVADVGGTVDDTLDTDERRQRPQEESHEALLFSAWKDSKELFARDSKTRLSQPRQTMKASTGWTDEQIEGWGLMLSRDQGREHKLQQKYLVSGSLGGKQSSIVRTKWTASGSGSGSGTVTEEEDLDIDPNAMGYSNRDTTNVPIPDEPSVPGARSSGLGRGQNALRPPTAANTQAARKRKEQGRGRGRASHNRRDGRAAKMGRGMAGTATG